MTHDGKRTGTISLYAALEIATGACHPGHTRPEFLAFPNPLVRACPREAAIHVRPLTPAPWRVGPLSRRAHAV